MAKKVEFIKPTQKGKDITKFVTMPVQIVRQRNDMRNYKDAVSFAENIQYPQRYNLYQIYINAINDNHLSAAIQQRKNITLCKKFNVVGKDGKINEEKSKLLQKRWFREYLDLALDSIFWGHSLVMFGDLIVSSEEFESVELVPRQYVKPEFNIVVKDWGDITGQSYLSDGFENWNLGIGKPRDLGLLLKASPLILWKNSAFGAWAEYQDKFGTPFRYVKTNVRDAETKKNAEAMMNNWGVSPWAVFDKDDVIEMLETAKQDAHQVFDAMITRVNSEISKLIVGQTATMDEKSFVGSAEVQERILEAIAESDEYLVSGWNNYQLVPLLAKHGILELGDRIEAEEAEAMAVDEKAKLVIEFIKTGKYKMSIEEIKENYGIELEEVEQSEPVDKKLSEEVKNELAELYK